LTVDRVTLQNAIARSVTTYYTGDQTMTNQQIRENFIEGKLTWADLLVITGLQANQLYEILSDLFDAYNQ